MSLVLVAATVALMRSLYRDPMAQRVARRALG
jgi:hypothetical protein